MATITKELSALSAIEARTQFVEVKGEKIAYRVIGSGDPLFALNRFRGTMDDWDPAFVDALATQRQVILFDSLGVGESSGETPTTLEAAADAAAGLAQALGIAQADFIGWSMGGMTAQILGLRHPDVVRGLILAGTLPPGGSPEVVPSSPEWSQTAGKPDYVDDDILYLFFTPSEASQAAGQASLTRIAKLKGGSGSAVGSSQAAMGGQYQAIMAFYGNQMGVYERLGDIAASVLVANGDQDGAFPVIDSVILAGKIPNAQLVVYPDSGHGFLFQFPERFAEDIHVFLNTL